MKITFWDLCDLSLHEWLALGWLWNGHWGPLLSNKDTARYWTFPIDQLKGCHLKPTPANLCKIQRKPWVDLKKKFTREVWTHFVSFGEFIESTDQNDPTDQPNMRRIRLFGEQSCACLWCFINCNKFTDMCVVRPLHSNSPLCSSWSQYSQLEAVRLGPSFSIYYLCQTWN